MISILGIPYDEKSSFQKGPAKAPPLIRDAYHSASSNYFSECGLDISTLKITDLGDLSPDSYDAISKELAPFISPSCRLLTIGGDHSVTYPLVKAHSNAFTDFDIIHFDAHGDLYDEFEGDRYSHACPFARIMEEKLTGRLIQVGVRTYTSHQRDQVERFNVEVIEMKDLHQHKLPELHKPVYISLDLDVLDPAFAPGISHYEPGGMTVRELIHCIHAINAPIIGADIVEYNPDCDINGMTAMTAAKLMKELIAQMHINQAELAG